MNDERSGLVRRIEDELPNLERVVRRVERGWREAQRSGDDLYLDSVGLNLHGFYGGVERLFETIASTVDGRLPTGGKWHAMLLDQMGAAVEDVRPAVISDETRAALDAYRTFRHVARNIYTFQLDPDRLEEVVKRLPDVLHRVRSELIAFASFLAQQCAPDSDDGAGTGHAA